MADELTIKIQGVEYPFPSFDTLTYKEARFIKKETGLVMGQFFDALENGDPDALMAIALIASRREGKEIAGLDDMLLTEIEIVVPAVEEPAEDPASPLDVSGDPDNADSNGDSPSNVESLSTSST